MRTKFYRISNKHDITLSVIKSTSYDCAFALFAEKKPQYGGEQVYANIVKPDELHELLKWELPIECVVS